MNKKESKQLFGKLKNKESFWKNIDLIAQSRSVLEETDLVKTMVRWLLSKDFLEKKNISEALTFIDFLSNKLTLADLEKDFEVINKKLNWIFNQPDWNTLENLIVETFNKNNPEKAIISMKKCPQEIDEIYKSDLLISYKYKWKKYKIGAQITTIDGEWLLYLKEGKIQYTVWELDKSKEEWKYRKTFELDSMMFIQLNWIFTSYLGRWKNILQKSLSDWKNNWYKWDLIEYIEELDFSIELLRFCELYPFIIGNYFKTVKIDINKTWFTNKTIMAPTWEKIKLHFIRNEWKIKFSVYDWENFLFMIVFYVNDKLLQKMYTN